MLENKPLSGILVLEQIAGEMAMIGKMLVEFGAQVIRLEPNAGLPDRSKNDDASHLIEFHIHNAGKDSLEASPDDKRLEDLMSQADIFLFDPKLSSPVQSDVEYLRKKYPTMLLVAVSSFGNNSRFSKWTGSANVFSALSGELSRSGYGFKDPLLPPGELTTGCAAYQAFFAVIAGLYDCLNAGQGRFIDFSVLDGASQALDPGFGITGSSVMGASAEVLPRRRPMLATI